MQGSGHLSEMKLHFQIVILILGIRQPLVYSQQLENVQVKLSSLASKLHNDKDIQENINRLARDGHQVATSFKHMLQTDGSRILTVKNRLTKTSYPGDVKVDILEKTLKDAKTALITQQKDIQALELDVHISIEECQGRKSKHIIKQSYTNLKLETIPEEIGSLDEEINAHAKRIYSLEHSVNELKSDAERLRRIAEVRVQNGATMFIFGALVGFAIVPIKGWTSLVVITAVTGINLVCLMCESENKYRIARQNTENANLKWTEACELRSNRNWFERKKTILQNEMNTLLKNSDELQQAATGLDDVSVNLRTTLNDIDNLLQIIQDMITAMRDAELASNSFEIIQNAFHHGSVKLDAKSKVYLDKLKEKWTQLERILLRYGAKATLA